MTDRASIAAAAPQDATSDTTDQTGQVTSVGRRRRLYAVDFARAIAVVLMIVYHFCWDLESFGLVYFGLLEAPFWLVARTVIAGLFLGLVGFSMVIAAQGGLHWGRYGRRLAMVAAGAVAISAVTYWMFADAWVFFGILHNITLGSLIALGFLRAPWWVALLGGVAALAVSWLLADTNIDGWLLWLVQGGTEVSAVDYVPLIPWFSATLFGMALAKLTIERRVLPFPHTWSPTGRAARAFGFVGRHTLAVYLIHQPILFGLLYLYVMIVPPGPVRPG